MAYHDKKEKKCRYCAKEAKRNITSTGRNKGHYRTCGSEECLLAQYSDESVSEKKKFRKPRVCAHCKREYVAKFANQKWCYECSPNKFYRSRMQRYGLSKPDFDEMVRKFDGKCYICKDRPARCVDHDHKTGRIRGMLCDKCNHALIIVEDKSWLAEATKYLENVTIP